MKTNNFTTKETMKKEYAVVFANKMMAADAKKLPYSIDWSKVQTVTELKKAIRFDQTLYKKIKSLADLKGEVKERVTELAEHLSLAAAKVAEPNLQDSTKTYILFQVEQHLLRTWNKLTYEQRLEADKALAEKTGVPEKMAERDAKRAEREQSKEKKPAKKAAPKKDAPKKAAPKKDKPQAKPQQQQASANEALLLEMLQKINARLDALEADRASSKPSRKTTKAKEGA